MVILARCLQPLEKLDNAGPRIWFAVGAAAQTHKCVRLLGTCGKNSTRAMVLEGPTHEFPAVGEQGRGERVTVVALKTFTIELEANSFALVDQSA